jgi:uncharacterized repeat protein (TIGR03806 family)
MMRRTRKSTVWVGIALGALLIHAACGGGETEPKPQPEATKVTPAPVGEPYDDLAEWGLFDDVLGQDPSEEVQPYEVISPLFSDYTYKRRFVWIPEGTAIGYRDDGVWQFPVGAILIKTFSYLNDIRDPALGEQLLETRLLLHDSPGNWSAHVYIYDEGQTGAVLKVAGAIIPSSWVHFDGEVRTNDYIVPNTNECEDCHGEKQEGALDTLGLRTRQLDREGLDGENQIDRFAGLGWFDAAPTAASERERLEDPFGQAPLTDRVRAYLDSNCGHCHTEGGTASESALLLSYGFTEPTADDANWGVCKTPTSAGGATCGYTFDIVPGDPDSSIIVCRLTSSDPEVRMPPLVSRVPHDEGIALIREWIEGMTGECGAM